MPAASMRAARHIVIALLAGLAYPVGRAESQDSVVTGAVTRGSRADVRFLIGLARFSQSGSEGRESPTGAALGLRVGYPHSRWYQFAVDLRLQAAGLKGPCTRDEARRGVCEYESTGQSLGDIGVSFGPAIALTPDLRLGVMVSPSASKRGWDRVEGRGHANRFATVSSASLTLDYRWRDGLGVWVEHRWIGATDFHPDSEAQASVGARELRSNGRTLTAALSVPLRAWRRSGMTADDPSFPMFGFVVENDLPWRDESYTNGIRAVAAEVPGTRALLSWAFAGSFRRVQACPYGATATLSAPLCRTTQLGITQTMHTPTRIAARTLLADDRPNAGTLFLSGRTEILHPPSDSARFWSLGSEVQVGVLGQSARSEDTQAMAHWLIATDAVRPTSWAYQLRDRWHLAWLLDGSARGPRTRRSYSDGGSWLSADLTARAQLIAGTTHQAGSIGLVGRWSPIGSQLPLGLQRVIAPTVRLAGKSRQLESTGVVEGDSPIGSALPLGPQHVTAPNAYVSLGDTAQRARAKTRLALVGSIDWRQVWKNVTLTERQIDTRPGLIDLGFGLQGEHGPLAVTALIQHRSREFAPRGAAIDGFARYWTLQLMYRPSGG